MKIWVDIANSPQVLFMNPIIKELQRRGIETVITTRRQSETIELADQCGFKHTVIGAHGGGSFVGKGLALAWRAARLTWFLRGQHIDLAISGSSYSQALTTPLLGIPLIAFNDYEGNPGMKIICRVARKILVPSVFSKENLYRFGAREDQIESYSGMKENVYLSDFTPDPTFLEKAKIPKEKILVTMRPASEVSAYHPFENPLFERALHYIAQKDNTHIILLSRNTEQRQKYEALGFSNVHFPAEALDGPNLIYYSDLVVGGGGTMNREAVVLGTPVYSLFMGLMGSIDRYLIDTGKMHWVNKDEDIPMISVEKKPSQPSNLQLSSRNLVRDIVDQVIRLCEE